MFLRWAAAASVAALPLSSLRCDDAGPTNLLALVGNTPLLRLPTLSELLGRNIFAKAEHLNPGGSVKDRAALRMVQDLEASGQLAPGATLVEATGGNTGVGLAMVAAAKGYRLICAMPSNVSAEKRAAIRAYGAETVVQPAVPFSDPEHFFKKAERIVASTPGAVFTNQFENLSNHAAHYAGTGPEIARALPRVDGFICATGTGGEGGGMFDARRRHDLRGVAVPQGEGAYGCVRHRPPRVVHF
jgi:cysteine synthase